MYPRNSDYFQKPFSILHSSEITVNVMFNSRSLILSYAKCMVDAQVILFDGHVIDIECSFLPQYG